MQATIEALTQQLPPVDGPKAVERFHEFAVVTNQMLENIAKEALNENWGPNLYVLRKYLAVVIPWAIEQGRVTFGKNQFYVSAGSLQTRYGTPIYLVFQSNSKAANPPWWLTHSGSNISAPELPLAADIPCGPVINRGAEVIMMHDHILGENRDRVAFLQKTPVVAQMCAVSGAIQWSLYRQLELPYWYFGRMQYLVPLYLENREDITLQPDLIAPVEASGTSLLVRTVLLPHMPYANARVAVKRHDQLPPWLLDSWNKNASSVTENQMENPEQQ